MTKITYIQPDGTEIDVHAREGESVMELAIRNNVKGIVAECGGACACATCHVFVDEAFADVVGAPGELEDDMLDGAATPREQTSRLSCQIKVRADLEGLRVRVAPEQF